MNNPVPNLPVAWTNRRRCLSLGPGKLRPLLAALVVAFAVDPARAAVVDAVEFYNASLDHYFVTASRAEIASLDGGNSWKRTGERFLVDDAETPDTSPVCRFAGTTFSSHFYSVDAAECATVKTNPSWKAEGVAFYVTAPAADGSCAKGLQVFRLYNDGHGGAPNHRYTTSIWVASLMQVDGWVPEVVAFCTSEPVPSLQPPPVQPELPPREVPGEPPADPSLPIPPNQPKLPPMDPPEGPSQPIPPNQPGMPKP